MPLPSPANRNVVADAGRIIAGSARGIRLEAPGPGTRPLADRVKQTLFAILEPDLPGARVLDLYAGSGAAGLEALSRGAAHVTFVERDAGATAVISRNLGHARLNDRDVAIVRGDVLSWLRGRAAPNVAPIDVAIVDPPYDEPTLLVDALEAVQPILSPNARVVAKHFWKERPPERIGLLASERERRFGETSLTFYRRVEDR